MSMKIFKKGQRVRVKVDFKVEDANGVFQLTDPTGVTFKYRKPDGTLVTLVYGTDGALVKTAVGKYYVDVICDQLRQWQFRYEGTGACQAVEEMALEITSLFG